MSYPALSPTQAVLTPEIASLPADLPTGHYAELKRRVKEAGLLEPQPLYYSLKIAFTVSLAIPGIVVLLITRNLGLQLLDALYLAFVFAQISFIGHDVGHRQVLRPGPACTVLELVCGNLLVGVSSSWWMTKHNQHHSHPNRTDFDPDVMLPVIAFSLRRAHGMNWAQRLMVRNQHVLYPFLTLLECVVLRVSSVQFLAMGRGRRWLLELALMAFHLGLYAWLIFHQFGVNPGIAFVVVHQMAFGFYMGSVFAPNHKGMLVIEDDRNFDFLLEQVLTSRNVSPSPIADFVYGGLNYQIEHHLFPSMARNQLGKAQVLVRQFCDERSIPYHQTGVIRSYREIFSSLRSVGVSLVAERKAAA